MTIVAYLDLVANPYLLGRARCSSLNRFHLQRVLADRCARRARCVRCAQRAQRVQPALVQTARKARNSVCLRSTKTHTYTDTQREVQLISCPFHSLTMKIKIKITSTQASSGSANAWASACDGSIKSAAPSDAVGGVGDVTNDSCSSI